MDKTKINNELAAETDAETTLAEMLTTLKQIKNNKAESIDNIPQELYKLILKDPRGKTPMTKQILKAINEVYRTGDIPLEWNDSFIVAIFKSGNAADPDNYRGITIINTLQKILCKILVNRINNLNITKKFITKAQSGFTRKEECVAQATTLIEMLERRKIEEKTTFVLFLDFKKAYDLVPHALMLKKLNKMGYGETFINFIKQLYQKSRVCVKIQNKTSEYFAYKNGLRQDCPLSPILFNIYINDFLDNLSKTKIPGLVDKVGGLHFSDDTVVFVKSKTQLEQNIKHMEKWCKTWHMEINVTKSALMRIESTPIQETTKVKLFDEIVPEKSEYKYLGIMINDQLDYAKMAETRFEKIKKVCNLWKATLANHKVPLKAKSMIIKGIISPSITYRCEIFGMNSQRLKNLKRLLDETIIKIVHVKNFQRLLVYRTLELDSLDQFATRMRARLYSKNRDSNKYIADLIMSSVKSRKNTWVTSTKKWLARAKIDHNLPTEQIKNLIIEYYKSKIKPTAAITFMRDYGLENIKIKNLLQFTTSFPTELNSMFKFLTGTLSWTSKLKRSFNYDINPDRKCIACSLDEKEDHFHFLFNCGLYADLRPSLIIRGHDITNPETLKKALKSRGYLRKLLKFIGEAERRRFQKLGHHRS